jgi:hypothetical protein
MLWAEAAYQQCFMTFAEMRKKSQKPVLVNKCYAGKALARCSKLLKSTTSDLLAASQMSLTMSVNGGITSRTY